VLFRKERFHMISIISPADNYNFSLLSPAQRLFLERTSHMTAEEAVAVRGLPYPWLDEGVFDSPAASEPASLIIKWKPSDPLHNMMLHISTSQDFSVTERIATVSRVFYDAADECYAVTVSNLLVGATYYYYISVGEETSEVRTFTTADGEIRSIRAEGVLNVRDTGGRYNTEGKRIRQGLIYRGANMNGLLKKEADACNGKSVLRDDLGIKTDLDLRFEAVGKYEFCPLGDHVQYKLFTADAYEGLFKEGQDELYRAIFDVIADEGNYPIFYHCVAGADRTGSVGFLLDAILGMSDEDILANYQLTTLTEERCWYTNVRFFIEEINKRYPNLSLREQLMRIVREYFCITEETIERIRRNLLED